MVELKINYDDKFTVMRLDIASRLVSVGRCLQDITCRDVRRGILAHLDQMPCNIIATSGNRKYHNISSVLTVLRQPNIVDFSRTREPTNKQVVRLRALYVILSDLIAQWPKFKLMQTLKIPTDLNEVIRYSSPSPFDFNHDTRPSQSRTVHPNVSQAQRAPSTEQGSVASPRTTRPPLLARVPLEHRIIFNMLWKQNNSDLEKSLLAFGRVMESLFTVEKKTSEIVVARMKMKEASSRAKEASLMAKEASSRARKEAALAAIAEAKLQNLDADSNSMPCRPGPETVVDAVNRSSAGRPGPELDVNASTLHVFIAGKFNGSFVGQCDYPGCNQHVCVVKFSYKTEFSHSEWGVESHHIRVYCSSHATSQCKMFMLNRDLVRIWVREMGTGSTTGTCQLCLSRERGVTIFEAEKCHDEARALGGSSCVSNLFIGHRACNKQQHTLSIDEYHRRIGVTSTRRRRKRPRDDVWDYQRVNMIVDALYAQPFDRLGAGIVSE